MAKKRQKKSEGKVKVVGRTIAYVQPLKKSGKLGKAKPVVITTVRAGSK